MTIQSNAITGIPSEFELSRFYFNPLYTPYAERKETGSDQLENEASWALFTRVRNMAAHGSVSSRLSQSLTEEDIPGASLQGRNPTALKTDELRFWLKCRGDPAKGLKTKAQLAKR